MDYAPWVRIILRYVIGAGIMGSSKVGEMLVLDPDVVAIGCVVAAGLVEGAYKIAKRRGWAT